MKKNYVPQYQEGLIPSEGKNHHYKYGEGIAIEESSNNLNNDGCCKGSLSYRTDYSNTMEPRRGARTYPSVEIIMGQ